MTAAPIDDATVAATPVTDRAQERRHLRRILVAFAIVVIVLPLVALGPATAAWLLVPLLLVAAAALREALRLRRLRARRA